MLIRSKVKSTVVREESILESDAHLQHEVPRRKCDTEDQATCEDDGGVQNRDSLFSLRFMWSRAHLPSLTRYVNALAAVSTDPV